MDNLSFAVAMIVVGAGGTLCTLWLLTLVIELLRAALAPLERLDELARKRED